jgi:undecaprenyl diphosphate synthase
VAIIMDGNGRWAERRGRPRLVGHRVGAAAVRRVTEAALRLGLEQVTLFAFSSENWQRPAEEVAFLMRLFRRFLRAEAPRLLSNGIRLLAIGRLHELPPDVREELARAVELTSSCRKLTLCLAVNYGARGELVDACRALARQVSEQEAVPEGMDEEAINACLYQPDMPPLDLIIRTGGEMRLSNFLLWQAAYAELWFTPVCWPDFREEHLREAVAAFRRRDRRFGGPSG